MRKFMFIFVAAFALICMAACSDNKVTSASTMSDSDSVVVDSVLTDSVDFDSLVIESVAVTDTTDSLGE